MIQSDDQQQAPTGARRVVYLHSEDLDGWLAPPNGGLYAGLVPLLARMEGLRMAVEGTVHELRIVLNSGKPPDYLLREAARFGGRLVIAGNGACWQEAGGPVRRAAPHSVDLERLRELLGVDPEAEGVVRVRGPEGWTEVALEPKRDLLGDLVLSLFPEPEPVAHRWRFRGGLERGALYRLLREVTERAGLALYVAEPHPDGAVDVLPYWEGRPLGKWTLPRLAREMFPGAALRLAHGGDGTNDLSAFEEPDVTPVSTERSPPAAAAARRRGGVLAPVWLEGPDAPRHCYQELARRGWYGPLTGPVQAALEGACRPPGVLDGPESGSYNPPVPGEPPGSPGRSAAW